MQQERAKVPSTRGVENSTAVIRNRLRKPPKAAGRMTPLRVVIHDGGQRVGMLPLRTGDNVIGRQAKAAVPLEDDGISRLHGSFVVDESHGVTLIDHNSTNGTFVNGERIWSARVHAGDQIRVGRNVVLELRVGVGDRLKSPGAEKKKEPRIALDEPSAESCPRSDSFPSKMRALEIASGSADSCWGNSGGALDAYERLLRIREQRLGGDHPSVAEVLDMMGRALQDDEQFQRAISCHKRAEGVFRSQQPTASARAACSIVRQAQCELAMGRIEGALRTYERAERLLECAGGGGYELAGVKLSIARMLWSMKREPVRMSRLAREAECVLARGGDSLVGLTQEAGRYASLTGGFPATSATSDLGLPVDEREAHREPGGSPRAVLGQADVVHVEER